MIAFRLNILAHHIDEFLIAITHLLALSYSPFRLNILIHHIDEFLVAITHLLALI